MKNNLVKLAKSGDGKTTATKNKTKKENNLDERQVKVKEKVNQLLNDVDLKPEIKKGVLGIETETPKENDVNSLVWLQEQLSILTEKNEMLVAELNEKKNEYNKLFELYQNKKNTKYVTDSDNLTQNNLIILFNELQENHFKYGVNFIIHPVAFMNRLIMFFPFLEEHKKF